MCFQSTSSCRWNICKILLQSICSSYKKKIIYRHLLLQIRNNLKYFYFHYYIYRAPLQSIGTNELLNGYMVCLQAILQNQVQYFLQPSPTVNPSSPMLFSTYMDFHYYSDTSQFQISPIQRYLGLNPNMPYNSEPSLQTRQSLNHFIFHCITNTSVTTSNHKEYLVVT